jgi:hypothetical protein
MNLNDYIIDQEGLDWSTLLSEWAWLLPSTLTLWLVNRLGDIVVVNENNNVSFFDIGCGKLKPIADSRDHFSRLLDEGDNANQWLAIPLIDRLVESGLLLKPKTVYGFKTLPILGGSYDVGNFYVASILEYYPFMGDIHGQIKDIPDGAQVRLKVINKPGPPN